MTTVFTLHHLDCASCAMAIEGIGEDMTGVTKAEVNVRAKQVTFEHDPAVTPEMIVAELTGRGYPVTVTE